MDCLEKKISNLLKDNRDITTEMIDIIRTYSGDEELALSPALLGQIKIRFRGALQEETVWETILSVMLPDEVPDEIINYLIQNKIALMQLCHMNLPDKWLKKLTLYDDAPLYTLAKRYYLSDHYSSVEFISFYQNYLLYQDGISIHLLELYKNTAKCELLLYLCLSNEKFEDKKVLEYYHIAHQLKTMTDTKAITNIYERYKNVGVIMLSLANNLFTPEDILRELSTVKAISGASEIRRASQETLKLKCIL